MNGQVLIFLVIFMTFSNGFNLTSIFGFIVLIISYAVYSLYSNQDKLLYQPSIPGIPSVDDLPPGYRSPGDLNLKYEDVYLDTLDKEKIHGWFVPAHSYKNGQIIPVSINIDNKNTDESDSEEDIPEIFTPGSLKYVDPTKVDHNIPTIIFFHENAGPINIRIPGILQMSVAFGCNVFIMDYRGYGRSSSGAPSEEGLIEDARASLEYVRSRTDIDKSRIYLFGRSLGGAVATALAELDAKTNTKFPPIRGIILENTFMSISDLVDTIFPFLKPIKFLVLKLSWKTITRIPNLNLNTLFISGGQDEIVPASHMQSLYDASNAEVKSKLFISNGTHNLSWVANGGVQYNSYFRQFLEYTGGLSPRKNVKKTSLHSYYNVTSTVPEMSDYCESNSEELARDKFVMGLIAPFIKNTA